MASFKDCCLSQKCMVALMILGILLVSAGVVMFFCVRIHYSNGRQPASSAYTRFASLDNWQQMPAATFMSFHVFDLKNPTEVISKGEPPALQEIGVVTYRESLSRTAVVVNQNDTISYRQPRSFFHEPKLSTIDPNTTITTVNIPLLTVVYKLSTLPGWIQTLVSELVEVFDGQLFVKKTVNELIWGYEDPLLKRVAQILEPFNISLEYNVGVFVGRNGTDDGLYNVFAGARDVDQINSMFTWNYNLELSYWNTQFANMLNGTDGTLFHPGMKTTDRVYVFSTDVCRSLYATYTESLRNSFDIDVLRFEIPDEVFADHLVVPENADFCTPPGNCLKAGILNVSICQGGLPIAISLPHLYQADPAYQHAIVGLHPNHDEHASFFDIEPLTGAVLNASKRLQINVPLRRVNTVLDMRSLPNETFFYPVLWLAESGQLDSDLANEFKGAVYTPRMILSILVPICLVVLGIVSAFSFVAVLLLRRKRAKEESDSNERAHLIVSNRLGEQNNTSDGSNVVNSANYAVNEGASLPEQSTDANSDR